MKIISDYAHIPIVDVPQLDLIDYMILKRDAFILIKSKTKEGREYLYNAYRLTQTEPERKKLRDEFGKR